jgi:hypothetical protein
LQFSGRAWELFPRHCEERSGRSNPAFLMRQSWIASLCSQ